MGSDYGRHKKRKAFHIVFIDLNKLISLLLSTLFKKKIASNHRSQFQKRLRMVSKMRFDVEGRVNLVKTDKDEVLDKSSSPVNNALRMCDSLPTSYTSLP